MPKKFKIEGLDKLLEGKSEEELAELRAVVDEIAAKLEAGQAPGKPVLPLESSVVNCPVCGTFLEEEPKTVQLPAGMGRAPLTGQLVQFTNCPTCRTGYMKAARS